MRTAVRAACLAASASVAVAPTGCLSPSGGAAAQLAATDFNNNTRFGRMELAAEQVAPGTKNQDLFLTHHSGWGGRVRIADAEIVGIKMKKDDDAEISVRVSWFRLDEEELRLTTLKQSWKSFSGTWRLASETRSDGDLGLIGEKIEQPDDAPPRENVHYPVIRIGQN